MVLSAQPVLSITTVRDTLPQYTRISWGPTVLEGGGACMALALGCHTREDPEGGEIRSNNKVSE